MRAFLRLSQYAMMALPLASCDNVTGPEHDILAARMEWQRMNARDYSFEMATQFSMFPSSGYVRIRVVDREVVEALDANGQPVQSQRTLESVWRDILAAHENGEVNLVRFSNRGVPLEIDLGPWEVDGGRHYSVRNFSRQR